MPWASGNYVELRINLRDAEKIRGPGDLENAVRDIMEKPYLAKQLARLNPKKVREELQRYGAWSRKELDDPEMNLVRLIWILASNILEEKDRK